MRPRGIGVLVTEQIASLSPGSVEFVRVLAVLSLSPGSFVQVLVVSDKYNTISRVSSVFSGYILL